MVVGCCEISNEILGYVEACQEGVCPMEQFIINFLLMIKFTGILMMYVSVWFIS